jgi:phage-related protein
MEYEIELYEKVDREIPVLDFIMSLDAKQQAKIYREIGLLEKFGNELHFPHVRRMEGKKYDVLWELRVNFASDIFRILYFQYFENKSILLHGFKKKTEKTSPDELKIALNRMNDYIRRKNDEME